MPEPPVVVVVDAVPGVGFEVASQLVGAGCAVDVLCSAAAAVGALSARRRANCPALLVLANHALPDIDAPGFAKHLLSRDPALAVMFYADLRFLPKATVAAVEGAGARFIAWPFAEAQLPHLLAALAARAEQIAAAAPTRAPAEGAGSPLTARVPGKTAQPRGDEQPGDERAQIVHGSARFGPMAGTLRTPPPGTLGDPATGPETAGTAARTHGGASGRRALNLPPMRTPPAAEAQQPLTPRPATPRPATPRPSTPPAGGRVDGGTVWDHQALTQPATPAPPTPQPQPVVSGMWTRRSLAGQAPPAGRTPSRQVRSITCPRCGAAILAEVRAESYVAVCTACGTQVRVAPG